MLDVLELLAGFWAGQEPALDAWFARHPDTAAALQWSRRSRSALLIDDLDTVATACGVAVPAVVPEPAVFPEPDEAEVLGWLYVAEGSTLGGAVIDRSLQRAGFPCRLTHVAPYPEGPQPMWRAYLAHLEAWTSDDPARVERVVAAGEAPFVALEIRTSAVSGAAA